MPEFKAGLHGGQVTTGRIGFLKKEIVFTGDVLNTTSRIQQLCNSHQVDLLLSQDMVDYLKSQTQYTFHQVGEGHLRGREKPVMLYTVQETLT